MLTFEHLWGLVITLATILVGVLQARGRDRHQDAMDAIEKAQAEAAAAKARADEAHASLAAHKLHAAETFARRQELKEAIDKVDASLERVMDKLDDITERLPPRSA